MPKEDVDFKLNIIQERLQDMVHDLNMIYWSKDGLSVIINYHMLIINNQIEKLRSEIRDE